MPTTEMPTDPYADRYEDEPEEELPPRPRRKLVTPAALVLCGVVIGAAGFYGGVEVQKGQEDGGAAGGGGFPGGAAMAQRGAGGGFPGGGQAPAGGAQAPSGAQTPGGGQAPGGGFPGFDGAAGGGQATIGEVTAKKGRTLYVQTSDGTTVKVTTNAGSSVVRTAATSAKDIYPGDTVVVSGEANAKGTVAATSIRATAASASAGR